MESIEDCFIPAGEKTLEELAAILGLTVGELSQALDRRESCLNGLAQGRGAGFNAMRAAVDELAARERGVATDPAEDTNSVAE